MQQQQLIDQQLCVHACVKERKSERCWLTLTECAHVPALTVCLSFPADPLVVVHDKDM